jgi:hypothetical protein
MSNEHLLKQRFIITINIALFLFLSSCNPNINKSLYELSQEQKDYWYAGNAEITSYNLKQARYGEMRSGSAVLVFVTEPFSTISWTKSDNPSKQDMSVLKLNFTKNFITGIYPYSMMTSTFLPVNGLNSLKISSSSQEWCGHTFMELKNKNEYEININSYFESESKTINLKKDILEDDIWSLIRLNPDLLPIGENLIIPSFFYLRLEHKEAKAYKCLISKSNLDSNLITYNMNYPDLERKLQINFEKNFPFKIISWEETYLNGFGPNKKLLTTRAEKINTLKVDYWTKNSNPDSVFRKELGL